ncbi:L-threonylcarbamoyladenylate synthase [Mesorhizobium sp.]|uniref:L-threonylcarbamoyladenylate synthase n=2 Tax=Mesorhizobium sp. TaxID=1871066 RepID=UPI000FEA3CFB|nr:L-threonylcarbamoyladenylate synthase [Mesorhizobium sp.]RWI16645.1 MAG: threonylcarbamoyl-AMP synthase [Mesorhizobium sp.]RWN07714.1 MAG: threonylcarbamoyl-AMP synthase [Mesorhizobium sp.]RWN12368.1 MAG: threonylcarbamoyl-AMP synthase [Mesorhizobium sp.]TIQ97760.1 MAG: threonylcarbamoyl-AMP synthase [Mesorhizobium sp.]
MLMTRRFGNEDRDIAVAAKMLRNGEIVAFPTETVYGLGADASNPGGIGRIYEAKARPRHNPLIVHVCDIEMAHNVAEFDPKAALVADRFWPGPLTMLLPKKVGSRLAPAVTAGLETVAVRFPSSKVAQRLIRAVGFPVAAPSANLSGKISPTRFAQVLRQLDGRIAGIVQDDACDHGLESTILSLIGTPAILRHGSVPQEPLEDLLGSLGEVGEPREISSPGQFRSHYAPEASVRTEVCEPTANMIWIGFGPDCEGCRLTLSTSGDLEEAARSLYDVMVEADLLARADDVIAFAPIPMYGLGRAINDRLRRAAAPR